MERTFYYSNAFTNILYDLFKSLLWGLDVSSYATLLIIYNVPNSVTDPFKDHIFSNTRHHFTNKENETEEEVKWWSWDLNHVLRFQDLGSFSHNMLLPCTSGWVGICPEVPPENPCCIFLPVPRPPSTRRDETMSYLFTHNAASF